MVRSSAKDEHSSSVPTNMDNSMASIANLTVAIVSVPYRLGRDLSSYEITVTLRSYKNEEGRSADVVC